MPKTSLQTIATIIILNKAISNNYMVHNGHTQVHNIQIK